MSKGMKDFYKFIAVVKDAKLVDYTIFSEKYLMLRVRIINKGLVSFNIITDDEI